VSAMVEAHPEIAELDGNPVTVLPDGAVVVDARALVRDHAQEGRRRLAGAPARFS
jgi:hypothetical protein